MQINNFTNTYGLDNTKENNNAQNEYGNSLFENSLNANNTAENEEKKAMSEEERQKVIDDIMSILRTGFTATELEELERLMKEMQARLQEQNNNGTSSLKDIKAMMDKLESTLLEFQKEKAGVVIKEAEGNDITQTAQTESNNDMTTELAQLNQRLKEAMNSVAELRKNIAIQPSNNYSQKELELLQEMKKQQV